MKRTTAFFCLLLLFAGYLRYTYLFAESVWVDETVYMWQGYTLANDFSLLLTKDYYGNSPVPLLFLAFFNVFIDDRFIAGRLVMYLFSVLGISLIYFLGKELEDAYVGFLAGLLVTVNPLHWFLGSRTLMDLPEATMVSLCAYCLLRFEKNRSKLNCLFLIIAVVATMFTKIPGFFVLPGIGLYYFLRVCAAPQMLFAELQKKETIIAIGTLLAISGSFVYANFSFIPWYLRSLTYQSAFLYHFPFMFTWPVIIFLGIGIFLSFFYRKWDALAILCIGTVFFAVFFFSIAEPDPRHLLQIIPLGIVIASYAYFECTTMIKSSYPPLSKDWTFLLIAIFFLIPMITKSTDFIIDRASYFTGYNEAGQWLAENLPNGTLAYVSSQGPMRLFSGLGYANEGGPLRQIQTFGSPPNFSKGELPIFLHLDMWELEMAWTFPNEKNLKKLLEEGFQIKKVVRRKYPTKKGPVDIPVHIFLVKK